MENRLLILLFLLVIISTILGTTVWGNKNQITSSPIETCTGNNVKVAYPSEGDPLGGYFFGWSVFMFGDILAVGSYGADTADYGGSAYVYTDGNYDSVPIKLANPSTGPPLQEYFFGISLSIEENILVVGSSGANQDGTSASDRSGIVYIYLNGNYESAPTKIAVPGTGPPVGFYYFGSSVSISGDTLAVGAYGANQDGTSAANFSGSVYVYTNGNYTSTPTKVANPSTGAPQANYYFGICVSISGDTLAVGASGANQNGTGTANNSGAVYVYTNGNYSSAPIKAGNPSTGAPQTSYYFGNVVSISGDTLAVGAFGANQDGISSANNSGIVYVYTNGNYASTPIKVANPTTGPPQASYRFGAAVSVSGDTLAVGAIWANQDGFSGFDRSGLAYIYKNGDYESPPIRVPDVTEFPPIGGYLFGLSVSVSGYKLAVGAPGQTTTGEGTSDDAGGAYVYPCIGF